ncbi:hypothetical protein BZG36_00952 [Bifiguratus adelaidae]|uniref:Phosphate-induced protein 1 n=1 Tax=Bifiguratus adelaidae TaxID=1938954 RepID=A0A261Y5D3_9FUNG|nr:hypothetical protein BZG36_00952 [Bifiguratus adelaidae]
MRWWTGFLLTYITSVLASPTKRAISSNAQLDYLGGEVVTGPVNVYLIFYGSWDLANETHHVQDYMTFFNNIGSSNWFDTLKLYRSNSGNSVTGPLYLQPSVIDNFSAGKSLQGNSSHIAIIEQAINHGQISQGNVDKNGLYFIIASDDVEDQSGFCTSWCSYNSWSEELLYAFIGNPNRCPQQCIPSLIRDKSPNNDPALDSIVNMMAHELQELLTDPWGDAYRIQSNNATSAQGEEAGDMCAPPHVSSADWFQFVHRDEQGAAYNFGLAGKNYLLQAVYNPMTKTCEMHA